MAHEIDQTTGRAAVFVTGEPAWHGLGTVVSEAQTSAEAITLAGLDWQVEKWPLQTYGLDRHGAAQVLDVDDQYATVRTDTGAVLGVVSGQYRLYQNAEAFSFLDELVGEKLALYETAGALRGGRRVWMLAKLPQELRVGRTEDVIDTYLLLANSHDGSLALRVIPTTVRVVCQNTLNLALSQAGSAGVTIRHLDSLEDRVQEAREHLGLFVDRIGRFQEEVDALAATPLSDSQAKSYFSEVFDLPAPGRLLDRMLDSQEERGRFMRELLEAHAERSERQKAADARLLEQLVENYHNGTNTLPGIEGTAWAAYNSVSQFVDHQGRGAGTDSKLNSIWFGEGNQLKQTAFARALELAGAA
jgi:phage/plasmid-like protein (TIGR03299 family)